jgi:hypothetical protein
MRRHELALVAFGAATFAAVFGFPLLANLSKVGVGNDWDTFLESAWAAVESVAHFGQMPHWDPYKCGGLPLLADPQSRVFTPFFILHLILGPVAALHLEFPLHLAIAWSGGYYLARQIGVGALGATVCASVFPSSSWLYLHFAEGHAVFMAMAYIPWMLGLWWRAAETGEPVPAAVGGLFAALAFAESGIYAAYLTPPLMGVVALTLALSRRSIKPLLALLTMPFFAAGFSAVKLLPVLALGISRPAGWPEVQNLSMLVQELFARNQDRYRPHVVGMFWGFHEYGAYVGLCFAALAMMCCIWSFKRGLPWLVGAVLMLALSAGAWAWWSPWALLQGLPLYSSEHIPSRFLILFVMALSPLAGLGAEAIASRYGFWGTATVLTLLAVALVDAWVVSVPNLWHVFDGTAQDLSRSAEFRQFWDSTDHQTFSVARSDQGALNCYAMNVLGVHARAYNQSGYLGEYHLTSGGTAALSAWSPNHLSYDVDVPAPTVLIVNQNYHEGWRLEAGNGQLGSIVGLIAVKLPAGKQHLLLAYRTVWLRGGTAVSLTTLAVLLAMIVRSRRRRTRPFT